MDISRGVTTVDDDWISIGTQKSQITNMLVLDCASSNVFQQDFSDILSQYYVCLHMSTQVDVVM